MLIANIIELYAYNRWANAETLDASRALTNEQLFAPLGASYSSVFGTLRHVLWLLGVRHLQRDTAFAPTRLMREPR